MSGLETHGLEQIPEAERTAKTRELFPTWVAANISVVGVTAPIVSYGLVGLIGIAGKRGGAPGMALSRAVFDSGAICCPGR
jgi:NCS1 family nucleobase:cation symporter-1